MSRRMNEYCFNNHIARKWNFRARKYEPYKLPAGNYIAYTDSMDDITTCPQCGKNFQFGECYTSRQIHNNMGFGYYVCEECYEREWEEEREGRKNDTE